MLLSGRSSLFLSPDPKGPCGQSEVLGFSDWQELNPRLAYLEAGMLTHRPKRNSDNMGKQSRSREVVEKWWRSGF